jgi:putative heme-binding domain-containing protein
VSIVLGLRQGRPEAVQEALQTLTDAKADRNKQLQYIQILGEVSQPDCVPVLLKLATGSADNALQTAALTALQRYDDAKIATAVLESYGKLTEDVRGTANALLVSRKEWARQLLEAIDAGQIDRKAVPPEVAQVILRHRQERLTELVRKHWGELKPSTPAELQKEIDRLVKVVRSGSGVPKQGKPLFVSQCARCHKLFGEGGQVGPDLTTYQRDDLETMMLHIVNPSAEIREGFVNYLVSTRTGRTLSGLLVEQDPKIVVLRGADGKDVTVAREEIDEMEASKVSLMPEGLLKGLSEQQVRDLFAYLRSTQPLIDK